MPKYRVSATGEWFYTATIEADDVIEAKQKLIEQIRNGLQPIHGPGITLLDVYRVVGEPKRPDAR